MKIKKKYRFIEIKISNPGKYTDVATFIDNLNFIDEIESARSLFKLHYDYPLNKDDTEKVSLYEQNIISTSDKSLLNKFKNEVERIRKQFKAPPHFRDVIGAAILYGTVYDATYEKAYLEEKTICPIEDPNEIPDMQYNIVIHAGTRIEDIEKVFKKYREKVDVNLQGSKGKDIKNHPAYGYGYWHDFSLNTSFDTRSEIIKMQQLYRRRINGESPLAIALKNLNLTTDEFNKIRYKIKHRGNRLDREFDKFSEIEFKVEKERNKIKTMINRYKKLVSSSPSIL